MFPKSGRSIETGTTLNIDVPNFCSEFVITKPYPPQPNGVLTLRLGKVNESTRQLLLTHRAINHIFNIIQFGPRGIRQN